MALNVATTTAGAVGAFSTSRASVSQLSQAQPAGIQLRRRDGACVCGALDSKDSDAPSEKRAGLRQAMAAALAAAVLGTSMDALADLNAFEANTREEFGIGSAVQFGSADLNKTMHANENFRRGNFTSADMKEGNFSGSTFKGGYLEKAVAYKANFAGGSRVRGASMLKIQGRPTGLIGSRQCTVMELLGENLVSVPSPNAVGRQSLGLWLPPQALQKSPG